jgi:hypothetical protein
MYTGCYVRLMEIEAPAGSEKCYWKGVYQKLANSETNWLNGLNFWQKIDSS